MTLSRNDIENLLRAGIEIVGNLMRVEDFKNKVTYEFPLNEIGQITIKKRFVFNWKKATRPQLVVHKWDTSSVKVEIPSIAEDKLKPTLKRVNIYFYAES